MRDPYTKVCDVNLPFLSKNVKSKDGKILYKEHFTLFTIWHVDPEKDGTDDSCGWFMRSRHGDEKVLEKIIKEFTFEWDRVFQSDKKNIYQCGLFKTDGTPNMSTIGIGLNLFWIASYIMLGHEKANKFMQKNLWDIIFFCENPHDSLNDSINQKFGKESKEYRIENLASTIYGYILRKSRPWYKHPKFHFWHYSIQCRYFSLLKRFLFSRCTICKGRFRFNDSVCSNSNKDYKWYQIEKNLYHSKCEHITRFTQCKIQSK